MLNGKFYTGLPPKMMDRKTGAQNRLESHLFWPDDSKTESVSENGLKRRSSLQANSPRDVSFQRQTSWSGGENEVDTKQRFHKEFAKSSIKFCDNIQEEEMDNGRQQAMRKPLLRKSLKQDIAMKPTALHMKLPHNDSAQEEYAAIKKNQAFSSKIRFYDYVDDHERQNNKVKPKMDMNDKKDVERNTKNSPKLQVKGIVRNLRMVDEQRNNDRNQRDHITPDRNYENYGEEERQRSETRIIRNEVRAEPRSSNGRFGERSDRYKHYESSGRSYRQHDDYTYNDDTPDLDDMQQQYNERRATPSAQSVPKRILKNPIRDERELEDQREAYNDLEYMERGTRNMRIHTSPKKHVTYGDEIYEYEARNGDYHTDDNTNHREQRSRPQENIETGTAVRSASYSSRNEMKSTNRPSTGNNQRQQRNRPSIPDYEANVAVNDEELCSNDHMVVNNPPKKSLSFNKNNNNNNNNNSNNSNNNNNNKNTTKLNNLSQQQQQQRKITPKISTSSTALMSNDSTTSPTSIPLSPTMDVQKHLRSSLCFSGGEIVASNHRAVAGSDTPTSEPSSRRTARSAATTRRICVGLPD